MKKLGIALLIVLMAGMMMFSGCAKATPHAGYNYRTTGHFADWKTDYNPQFMMENISSADKRVASIKSALSKAANIYLWEYNSAAVPNAGWNVEYPGARISQDGKFAMKFIRMAADPTEPSGWFYDNWLPSPEMGGLANLTPDTLYSPPDRSEAAGIAANDGLGSYLDNPVLLKGNVTYYIIFAVMKDNSRAMGAIVK